MHSILVLGAGKIGSLIACLLHESERYRVHLADVRAGAANTVAEVHRLDRLVHADVDAS